MQDLEKPSNELVEKYLEQFNQDSRSIGADMALNELFETFPKNDKCEHVLLKVSVLNQLYSTNVYDIASITEHILSLNIDDRLQNQDLDLVHDIAQGHSIISKKTGIPLNFYSFATKYCNWHNPEFYPIYDSFVEKMLIAYKKEYAFSSFLNADLNDVKKFKRVLEEFAEAFEITYNLKEIDKFLWVNGRTFFPNDYSKKKILKLVN